jgi:dipeptidyl aminopeptidase/acylaminoacyl peptidase
MVIYIVTRKRRRVMKCGIKIFYVFFITTISILFVLNVAFSQQTAGQLFEKALYLEEARGELQQAVDLYQQILKQYPKEREFAAKAQLHLGFCYEKLGLQKAKKAYQQVIDSYPEQTEAVKIANEKLSLLLRAKAVIRQEDKEINIRKIWAGPDVDIEGAPSPDGRYLSYVDWKTGDLAIYEIASGKKRRITNKGSWDESDEFALFSRWSPDGKQICYEWHTGNDYCDLRIIGLDESRPRILYSNKEVNWTHPYDWSPDGEQIVAYFESGEGIDWITQIVLISTADGFVRVLKTSDGSWPENMCFSPDGRYIVYDFPQKTGSPERDIFLMSCDEIREIPLVEHPSHDELLGWAPDGENIIFASDRNGTVSL